MLPSQEKFILSQYTGLYDLIIPQDNPLRQIKDLVDFSFVYQELKKNYCTDNGATAESPIRMFKYLFLKRFYDLSDRGVTERAMYDMSFKYFLDLAPEAQVIDYSTLSVFRRKRLKNMDLLDILIKKTVKMAVDKGLIKSRTIIIDATHTTSRSNPIPALDYLRLRSKQLRKNIYSVCKDVDKVKLEMPEKNDTDDIKKEIDYSNMLADYVEKDPTLLSSPAVNEELNKLKETIDDIEDHFTISADKDARVGHKSSEDSFLGYKTHLAMTDERIITAATVTSGEKPDGPELKGLVEKSRENLGGTDKVDTVLADGAYSGNDNLKLAHDKESGFELISRTNPMLHKGENREEDGFELNKDAGMYTCPAGHLAKSKRILHFKEKGKGNDRISFMFDPEKCKVCKLKDTCMKPGAKTRTYSISIKTDDQKQQMEFEKTDAFKAKARQRYKIEAKNAELKNIYGYDTAISYGLHNMQLQGAMTIFVANIMRIVRMTKK